MNMRLTALVALAAALAAAVAMTQSTWNGSVSTAWSNATNWTPAGVPTASTNVIIASTTNQPTLDVTANANSLTINAGATLNGANRTLYVAGNFTNNGTFTAGTGTVEMNGAVSAAISGTSPTTFNQLIVRKGSYSVTVTAQQNFTVNGSWPNSLVLEAGTFDVAAATVTAKGLWSNYSTGGVKQFRMNNAAGKFIVEMASFCANNTTFTMSAGTVECNSEFMMVGDGVGSPYSVFNVTGGTVLMHGPNARINLIDGFTHNAKWLFNLEIGKNAGDKAILNGSVGSGGTSLLPDLIIKNQLKINSGASLLLKSGSYPQYHAIVTGSIINDGTFDPVAGTTSIEGACSLSGASTTNFAGLTINAGATFTPQVNFGFSGNFTNNGTFAANGKTVSVVGAGTSTIGGNSSTTFAGFTCTAAGKQITFASGKTYTFTGAITLTGASGNLIRLRSSTTGTQYSFDDRSTESVSFVDVQDCRAINSITDYPGGTDSGNNQNWVFGPVMTLSVLTGTNGSVFNDETGGGNGYKAVSFSISNSNAGVAATLNSITFIGSGTGNHTGSYLGNGVMLYRETGATAGFDMGDVQIAAGNFNSTPAITFNFSGGEASFSSGDSKSYYLVIKLNGTASAGQTFAYTASALNVTSPTTTANVPSNTATGFSIIAPTLTVADNSSTTQASALTGSAGNVIQKFTITNTLGPANTVSGITVSASGSGNEATDISAVKLVRDANANGQYDAATDVVVNNQTFSVDNGTLVFALSGGEAQFAPAAVKQFFVVVDFTNTATSQVTFATQVTALGGALAGTTINGVPAPAAGTAGIMLTPNLLAATLNGPASAATVSSFAQGQSGNGLVICDVSLSAQHSGWTVTSLTFRANGTGNDQSAYNYLALFEDSNSNGAFDGAAGGDNLAVAGAAGAFSANDGDYTANLLNGTMSATVARRFFLVGKLAGTASAAQTFGASLNAVAAAQPQPGQVSGTPTASTTALVIDAAALTVANAPNAPADALIESLTSFGHTLALFRFTATNMNVPVTSLRLTAGGNGNWAADVSLIELWADNGDGQFSQVNDTPVGSAAGAMGSITIASNFVVANGSTTDVWVQLNLNASAAGSTPKTFTLSIAATGDVTATGAVVVVGTPAPNGSTLSAVRFEVTQFTPAVALQNGGEPIVIRGSGFMAPVSLTIGGVTCPGTGVVNATGTEVTGFITPAGQGQNKIMVLTNGALGPKTLPMPFNYATANTVGGGGSGAGGGGGGCSAGEGGVLAMFMAILAAVAASRRRRLER